MTYWYQGVCPVCLWQACTEPKDSPFPRIFETTCALCGDLVGMRLSMDNPDYTIAQLRRILENYQAGQEHGLDRGTEGQVHGIVTRADLWRAISTSGELTRIEQEVIFYHGLQGRTQDETAELVHRSQQIVSRHARRAVRKIFEWLNRPPAKPSRTH